VSVAPAATTVERVDQYVSFVNQAEKQALLTMMLRAGFSGRGNMDRVLIFSRTKHGADRIVKQLAGSGIPANAIHGNKSQPQRERALAAFRAGACRVLVATDIAARGIDVDGVTHVINFEVPNVPESYVHRIGRTARAGAAGVAISFCNEEERAYLRDIERLTRLKVPVEPTPAGIASLPASAEPDRAPPSRGERQRQPGRNAPGRNGSGRNAPGRNRPQPAQAEANGGNGAQKRRRRRKNPQGQEGRPQGQDIRAQGQGRRSRDDGAPAPALPGFVLSSAQERRSQGASGAARRR
jgi:ATP-dependent RNA helicase RhlE